MILTSETRIDPLAGAMPRIVKIETKGEGERSCCEGTEGGARRVILRSDRVATTIAAVEKLVIHVASSSSRRN